MRRAMSSIAPIDKPARRDRMGTRGVIAVLAIATTGLGAFVATGFGQDEEPPPAAVETVTVDTHRVEAPSNGAPKLAQRRATLFKVIYKESDATPVGTGYRRFLLKVCPRNSGILSAWHVRAGTDKSGLLAAGGTPNGVRRWDYVVNNVSGAERNAKFGFICIK
jgi:hypothetical protein